MRREKLESLSERDIVKGLVLSDKFCRDIVPILNPRLLANDYARCLASWCCEYYNKYKEAPKQDLIKLYRVNVESLKNEALEENILAFIDKMDDEMDKNEKFNAEYAVEQAVLYLKKRSLRELIDRVDASLTMDDIKEAEDLITKYNTVSKNGSDVSSIVDEGNITESFVDESEELFTVGGAYGKVVGKIHREDFISFLAPMKRGKTFALMDMATRAMRSGLKVLYVSLEMSNAEITRRLWTNLTGQGREYRDDIQFPYFTDDNKIEYKTIKRKGVIADDVSRKTRTMKRMFRGGDIRIMAVPAYTLTVDDLDIKIDRLVQQEGYVPDVIVIDYADIMVSTEKGEYRNQLDGIWKRLRRMAQGRKCAVFTATQSNRTGFTSDLTMDSVAEDVRKFAHVTSMIGINQNDADKKKGIVRFAQLALRDGEQELRQAVCTECLAIGRIVTDSRFSDEVDLGDDYCEDEGSDDESVERFKPGFKNYGSKKNKIRQILDDDEDEDEAPPRYTRKKNL